MNVCVITEDKMLQVDGEALNFDFTIDSNIHAIQWSGTEGHIEFKDGTPNEDITDFTPYQSLIDAHNAEKQRIVDYELNSIVSFEELRTKRDNLLEDTDFRVLSDYQGNDQQAWLDYRQELRDLPDGYEPVKNPSYPKQPGAL
jgi:phage-related protein